VFDASPAAPVFTPEPDVSFTEPSVFAARPETPTPAIGATEDPPPTSPVFVFQETPAPPSFASAPPAPSVAVPPAEEERVESPSGLFSEPTIAAPPTPVAEPLVVAPPTYPAATADSAVFEPAAPQLNGAVSAPGSIDTVDDLVAEEDSGQMTSAASMATEILSASPDVPTVATPEVAEAELISKDLTLIARGRKRRFRLH
jgi:hypothetical protein